MINPILYCFISHGSVLEQDKKSIADMCAQHNISDFVIVCGGNDQDTLTDNTLHLHCDDSYEGLPDKIHAMFGYLVKNLPNYKIYAKLDRLTKIIKPINFDIPHDYFGIKNHVNDQVNRVWHFNKCSATSSWNNKPYMGGYVPWCGGPAYLVSNTAAKIIAQHPPNLEQEIYEDLYVATRLLTYGNITPCHFDNINEYFFDSL